MRPLVFRFMLLLMMLLALAGCGQAPAPAGPDTDGPGQAEGAGEESAPTTDGATASHGGPIQDQVTLLDHLRGMGMNVELAGEVQQPFFSVPGTTVRLSGQELADPVELQVFNYEDAATAEANAAQLGPDGNPKTMMIDWMAPPHFFRAGQVIVLYVGSDQQVLELLNGLFGPQFAGQ